MNVNSVRQEKIAAMRRNVSWLYHLRKSAHETKHLGLPTVFYISECTLFRAIQYDSNS